MGLIDVGQALVAVWRRKLVLVVALVVGVVLGVASGYRIDLGGPTLQPRALGLSAAQTSLVADLRRSVLSDADGDVGSLSQRAGVLTAALGADAVRARVARRLGLPLNDVRFSILTPAGNRQLSGTQRAAELLTEGASRQVALQVAENSPVITVATQAPTVGAAVRLADVTAAAAVDEAARLDVGSGSDAIVLRQIAPAVGGGSSGSSSLQVAIVVGIVGFVLVLLLLSLIARALEDRRLAAGRRSP